MSEWARRVEKRREAQPYRLDMLEGEYTDLIAGGALPASGVMEAYRYAVGKKK